MIGPMLRAALTIAVIGAVIVLAPSLARADGPDPAAIARARELDDRGRAAHDAGDYGAAIAAFKEAYVLAPSPGVLFNLAQAYRLHGDCDDAVLIYRRYLAAAPDAGNREIAEQHLATVERCAAGAALLGPVPAAATTTTVSVATPLRSEPTSRGSTERRVGFGLAAAGVVALGASLVLAIDAHEAAGKVSSFYDHGGAWSAIADEDARGRRDAAWADGLAIGGAAAVITGGVLYGLGHRAEHAPPIALSASAHGARASVSWQF